MAQITWRNIQAPDFSGSIKAMGAASEGIGKGLGAVENVITDQQSIDRKNFENITRQNDLAIQAELQGMQSLGELNQAEKNRLSLTQLTADKGIQYNPEAVAKAIATNRSRLQNEALNVAIPVANQVADTEVSVMAGGQALGQKLTELDMKPQEIQSQVDTYIKSNAPREAMYEKQKEINTYAELQNTPTPRNPDDIKEYYEKLKISGKPVNAELFLSRITEEFEKNRIESTYQEAEQERKLVNNTANKALKIISKTGNVKDLNTVAEQSGLKISGLTRLYSMMLPILKEKTSLSPRQEAEYNRAVAGANTQLKNAAATNANYIAAKQTEYVNRVGITPEMQQAIKTSEEKGEIFLDFLNRRGKDTGILTAILNIDVKHGDTAISVLDNELRKIESQGIKGQQAKEVLYAAMERTFPENQNIGSGSGVNKMALDTTVKDMVQKYKDNKDLRESIQQLQVNSAQELDALKLRSDTYNAGLLDSYSTYNLNREQVDPMDFVKDVESKTPTITPGSAIATFEASVTKPPTVSNEPTSEKPSSEKPSSVPINRRLEREALKAEVLSKQAQPGDHKNSPRDVQVIVAEESLGIPYDRLNKGFILPGLPLNASAEQSAKWMRAETGMKELEERGIDFSKKKLKDGSYILKIDKRTYK